ncbi:MAG: hemerythrin family protein [Bacteroidetes bacterium]|nr:hemerythrin family protein [Bacteroidota bacterium]
MDINKLKISHLVWRINFRSMIYGGKGTVELSSKDYFLKCPIGVWLDEVKVKYFVNSENGRKLIREYEALNQKVESAFNLFIKGRFEEAKVVADDYIQASNRFLEFLDSLSTSDLTNFDVTLRPLQTEKIYWGPAYETSLLLIDSQHRQLVNIVNKLCDLVNESPNVHIEANLFEDLESYMVIHFSTEESMMEEIGYVGTEIQKENHRLFIKSIYNFKQRFNEKKAPLTDLIGFLVNWLNRHILEEDKQFCKAYLEKSKIFN